MAYFSIPLLFRVTLTSCLGFGLPGRLNKSKTPGNRKVENKNLSWRRDLGDADVVKGVAYKAYGYRVPFSKEPYCRGNCFLIIIGSGSRTSGIEKQPI